VGDKISGKVIAVGRDAVFVDTGTKIDGVVEREELLDEDGQLPCGVGDVLDLFVVSAGDSEIRLSKALSGAGSLEMLEEARDAGIPVEARVQSTCKGGFTVTVMGRRAFCPISQMDVTYVEDGETYVGQQLTFLIERIEERGRNIVVSRRKLLEVEIEKQRRAFLENLQEGDVVEGRVTRLMPYGAFVEICPGLEGMLHVSQISWSRVHKPEDLLAPGQDVRVKVTGIETREESSQLRISLSLRDLTPDPWESVSSRLQMGEKVRGTVTRCVKFGAFVEIEPGIEGLVHISEMSYAGRVHAAQDVVTEGETVSVMIKEIDAEKRRISLSIKDAEGDPWVEVPEKYGKGKTVTGIVEKKEKFGLFIQLEPGVTGLLPKSKFDGFDDPAKARQLKAGDQVQVKVAEINPTDRKMVLVPAGTMDEGEWQPFAGDAPDSGGVSDLGEKLRRALAKKE
jgi:small subunit ribosomal protein S1